MLLLVCLLCGCVCLQTAAIEEEMRQDPATAAILNALHGTRTTARERQTGVSLDRHGGFTKRTDSLAQVDKPAALLETDASYWDCLPFINKATVVSILHSVQFVCQAPDRPSAAYARPTYSHHVHSLPPVCCL